MLIADSTPDPAALGLWIQIFFYIVLAVCGVISTVAVVVKAIRRKDPAPDAEYVTRGEMMREISRIDADLKDLKTYIQTRTHDLANKLHAINIRIVWMMGLLTQLASKTDGVTVPGEPMISTPDEA